MYWEWQIRSKSRIVSDRHNLGSSALTYPIRIHHLVFDCEKTERKKGNIRAQYIEAQKLNDMNLLHLMWKIEWRKQSNYGQGNKQFFFVKSQFLSPSKQRTLFSLSLYLSVSWLLMVIAVFVALASVQWDISAGGTFTTFHLKSNSEIFDATQWMNNIPNKSHNSTNSKLDFTFLRSFHSGKWHFQMHSKCILHQHDHHSLANILHFYFTLVWTFPSNVQSWGVSALSFHVVRWLLSQCLLVACNACNVMLLKLSQHNHHLKICFYWAEFWPQRSKKKNESISLQQYAFYAAGKAPRVMHCK